MGRRNDHTRNEIKEMAIKAGLEVIEEKGFLNCSARKVAARIGYSPGTLYNVFEDYDELVFHINAVTLDDLQKYIEERLDQGLEGIEAIKRLGACYIEFANENDFRWRALFDYLRPLSSELPEWYLLKVNSLFAIVENLILPFVQGDKEGAQRVANVLWGECMVFIRLVLRRDWGKVIPTC